MPFLGSVGMGRAASSLVAFILPVTSIFGRLTSGWLGDRFGKKQVYIAGFVLTGVGLCLFEYVTAGRMVLIVVFIITFCLGWGVNVTTRMTLLREYFGRANFGTILGITSGVMTIGHMVSSPLAGWVFDTWGSYRGVWLAFGGVSLAATVLVLTIPSLNSMAWMRNQPMDEKAIK